MEKQYDVIIVGGGPGGYVSAIRASQFGMSVALIETHKLGGTCLNIGCIPTKALYKSAIAFSEAKCMAKYGVHVTNAQLDFETVIHQKDEIVSRLVSGVEFLLKRGKVDIFYDFAVLIDGHTVALSESDRRLCGKNIILATGSHNAVPPVPGLNGTRVIGSTEALCLTTLPESMIVIGGGVIGLELGAIFQSFGTQVTVIEMLSRLLVNMDAECSGFLEKKLKGSGMNVLTNAKVVSVSDTNGKKEVCYETDGRVRCCQSDYVLVATGRAPNSSNMGLEKCGVCMTKGWINVNEFMQTNIPSVYAIGDVTGNPALAHAAYEAGVVAVEHMNGKIRPMDFTKIAKTVFVKPELSAVGMTEEAANAAGYDVCVGKFPLSANGKALSMRAGEGFVKVVSEKKDHRILGVHIAGADAAELIATAANWMEAELTLEAIAEMVFPHPSLSEALKEACLATMGRALHS